LNKVQHEEHRNMNHGLFMCDYIYVLNGRFLRKKEKKKKRKVWDTFRHVQSEIPLIFYPLCIEYIVLVFQMNYLYEECHFPELFLFNFQGVFLYTCIEIKGKGINLPIPVFPLAVYYLPEMILHLYVWFRYHYVNLRLHKLSFICIVIFCALMQLFDGKILHTEIRHAQEIEGVGLTKGAIKNDVVELKIENKIKR